MVNQEKRATIEGAAAAACAFVWPISRHRIAATFWPCFHDSVAA